MATTAVTPSESDVGARVNGETIILVLDDSARDVDAGGRANVKSISVVATLGITKGVIHVDIINTEVGDAIDAESLDGGVDDVQFLDVGVLEGVGAEELGLGLATVAALGIPPTLTFTVNGVARGTLDEKIVSGESNQGTFPQSITESSLSLEDDLRFVS